MEAIATLKEPGGCNKTTIGAYIEVFCFRSCIFFFFSHRQYVLLNCYSQLNRIVLHFNLNDPQWVDMLSTRTCEALRMKTKI
jgi:hypothetical protein